MDVMTLIYLGYSFLSFYFFFLFLLIYVQNRKDMNEWIKPERDYSLSIVIPCYNEETSIGETIEGHLKSEYKNLQKIIVVDDCSTDNSYEIIKKYAKQYPQVMACQTPKNSGRAAGSKNYGAKFVNTELIGFSDADSFPSPDAIMKMVGFFNDPKTGAVTSRVLVRNRDCFLGRLQAIEYKVIAFTRKLFGFIDSIYVTNGPLSIYRKKAFDEVHGFDEKNLTEDIEITWHFVKKGYKVHMALPAIIYTIVPESFRDWFKQRLRWNVGGMQTVNKYKKSVASVGMLGLFILPFFVTSWILGITGLGILIYRVSNYVFSKYLVTTYSVQTQAALVRFSDFSLTPNILIFFGILSIALSLSFTSIALLYSKEKDFKKHGLYGLIAYMFVYLLAYPVLLVVSIYKFFRGKDTW